jgi:hypothetical protein
VLKELYGKDLLLELGLQRRKRLNEALLAYQNSPTEYTLERLTERYEACNTLVDAVAKKYTQPDPQDSPNLKEEAAIEGGIVSLLFEDDDTVPDLEEGQFSECEDDGELGSNPKKELLSKEGTMILFLVSKGFMRWVGQP